MRRSIAAEVSPCVIGATALLGSRQMTYVDSERLISVAAGWRSVEFPKDGHSDVHRLREALQQKTPLGECGGELFVVLPAPLMGQVSKDHNEFRNFEFAWRARKPEVTHRRWDGCFLTKARDYKEEDSFVELDCGDKEHYYNVMLMPHELHEFSRKNPALSYKSCSGPCSPKKHFHGVHGFYAGSRIFGNDCAPPFCLSPQWAKILPFAEGDFKKIGITVQHGTWNDPGYASVRAVSTKSGDGPEDGAYVLSKIMDDTNADWYTWERLCELYRSPVSVHWASTVALISTTAGQKKIKSRWNEIFQDELRPMLKGDGTLIRKVIQHAWNVDDDSTKILANYFMRRLFSGAEGVNVSDRGELWCNAE